MTTVPRFAALTARAHWRTVDFISDLHLQAGEPGTFHAWRHYLLHTPADAVFMLGDLFEAWVGDDCALPGSFEAHCGDVLRVAGAALDLFFMRGNRDFLVGADFLARHGVHELADPTLLDLPGLRCLLTHGDLLCTDDLDYQRFRQQVRSDAWQAAFLARPLAERQALAAQMREQSQAHQAAQPTCADTDDALARQWLQAAGAQVLIHGHTHRPADHDLGPAPGGGRLTKVVLSDWHVTPAEQRAQVLRLSVADGLQRVAPGEV